MNELTGTKHNISVNTGLDPGALDPGPLQPGMIARISTRHDRDVALSFQFNADTSRVFYALSIPEYLEVWLKASNTDDLHFVFNEIAEDTFRIHLYRGESLQASVDGSCWVVGANQVRYIWKTTSSIDTTETLVDMKLLSSSGGCVLALKHSGFNDPAESARCRRMWQQSLERLGRLRLQF